MMASRRTELGGSQLSTSDWSAYTSVSSLVWASAGSSGLEASRRKRADPMAIVRRMAVSFVALRSRFVGGRGSVQKVQEQYPRGVRAVKTAPARGLRDRESTLTATAAAGPPPGGPR